MSVGSPAAMAAEQISSSIAMTDAGLPDPSVGAVDTFRQRRATVVNVTPAGRIVGAYAILAGKPREKNLARRSCR